MRVRSDNTFGTTTNAPLLVGGTTLNSAGLANLGVVASPDIAVITLDPNRVNGAPEIVYVTAHTGAATSATILRGQEGTAAREHPVGTFWVHGATGLDFAGRGVVLRRAALQSIPDAVVTAVSWDTEDFDSDGFIAVTATTITVPAGLGGWYAISAVAFGTGVATTRAFLDIVAATRIWRTSADASADEDQTSNGIVVRLLAAETVRVDLFQDSAGAMNMTARLEMVRIGP